MAHGSYLFFFSTTEHDLSFYDTEITQKIYMRSIKLTWHGLLSDSFNEEHLLNPGLRTLSVSSFGLYIVPRLLTVMICSLGQFLGVSIRNDKQQQNDLTSAEDVLNINRQSYNCAIHQSDII